nr:hypothetical protein [Tanacetum cinerariifolium]
IQVAKKKVKIAFENADSSSRVELIPSKIKYANKVVLNFHKEFLVFSSLSRKGNDGLLQDQVFKYKEEVSSMLPNKKIVPKIMETEANDSDHLVNYDNDNDIDDLGYESQVYLDDEEEDDENNHSNGNVVKMGIIRLSKFRKEYEKTDRIKLIVTFNALNSISGKHKNEEPPRGILWLKGRVNKYGEFPDDEIRSAEDKLKASKDKIREGTLKVDHGTDVMTLVLASDERIVLLQSQLDNERRERQEKELKIQNLSNKMSQIERMVTKLVNQLAVQREQLKSMSTQLTPPDVSPVEINPIDSSADEEGGTPVVGCENDASIQKSNGLATSEKEMETREIKCKLWHLKKSIIIALGTVYETDGKQMLHNKELPKDCYKVSIDKSLVDAACIPDVGNNGLKTVKDVVGVFFHGQRIKWFWIKSVRRRVAAWPSLTPLRVMDSHGIFKA